MAQRCGPFQSAIGGNECPAGNVGEPTGTRLTDKEILDLIEDFLVNHFGQDERSTMTDGEALDMLKHIENFVELR